MTTIKFSLLLSLAMLTYSMAQLGSPIETQMTLYFQDYSGGPNATVIDITRPRSEVLNFTRFGGVFVTDDPITIGFDANSTQIARGQGLYVISSLDGSNCITLLSIVFTDEAFGGSTLELQSTVVQLQRVQEIAIIGGTGKFRYARGYATFETVYFDVNLHYAVVQFNVTVLHYNSTSS